jgi:hypothetical protein
MGADYVGQEKAIAEINGLSKEAKGFLSHHICNPLCVMAAAVKLNRIDLIQPQVDHIVDDLIMSGIRDQNFRRWR